MLKKVISGGQTGADRAGLRAAKWANLETGGAIPKGWKTEKGSEPELAEYGLVETKSDSYVPRTYQNAKDSDGTIRFALNFKSAGEKCTLKGIEQYSKPHIDVDLKGPIPVEEVVQWVKDNAIETLNVAGNRESTAKGVGKFSEDYLKKVFQSLATEGDPEHELPC